MNPREDVQSLHQAQMNQNDFLLLSAGTFNFEVFHGKEMHFVFGSKTRKRSNLVFEVLNFHHMAIDGNLCMKSSVFEHLSSAKSNCKIHAS